MTKFSQVSVFSGFNQPKDISMDRRFEALCGITQEEVETYFAEPIREMAELDGISVVDEIRKLKRRYDGYHFSSRMTDIYNPFSLLNAFDKQEIRNYWFTSGTPEYLVRLLSQSDENIEELLAADYSPEAFADYKATVEMPLPMIYQSGYLTIKSYDRESDRFMLDFPNDSSGYLTRTADSMSGWAAHAGRALNRGDLDSLRDKMESLLADIPYSIRNTADEKARERDFQYTFYLIFRMLGGWKVYAEKASSRGRADCIVELHLRVQAGRHRRGRPAPDRGKRLRPPLCLRHPQRHPHRSILFLRHRQHRGVESGVNRKNMLLQTHDMANNAATSSSAKPKKDGAQE